jgi:hypothetical protein
MIDQPFPIFNKYKKHNTVQAKIISILFYNPETQATWDTRQIEDKEKNRKPPPKKPTEN